MQSEDSSIIENRHWLTNLGSPFAEVCRKLRSHPEAVRRDWKMFLWVFYHIPPQIDVATRAVRIHVSGDFQANLQHLIFIKFAIFRFPKFQIVSTNIFTPIFISKTCNFIQLLTDSVGGKLCQACNGRGGTLRVEMGPLPISPKWQF